MNKKKRIQLKEAEVLLARAMSIVEEVKDDEQMCIDNIPENLQESERYTMMENCIDNLDEALDCISQATDCLDSAQNGEA